MKGRLKLICIDKYIQMAKGKKCPNCLNWTMHEKKPGYWYCSTCKSATFN